MSKDATRRLLTSLMLCLLLWSACTPYSAAALPAGASTPGAGQTGGTGTGPLTRMLTQPAISVAGVAFLYANDLWAADADGQHPHRLTTGSWAKTSHDLPVHPAFSPDGSLVAFSGTRDGNTDVYVVPAAGGEPRRLTWHPAVDLAQGFTPDGKAVLFSSTREAAFTSGIYQDFRLYTIPLEAAAAAGGESAADVDETAPGGLPQRVPVPSGYRGAYSPDGQVLAYNPYNDAFEIWKGYRGGLTSVVQLYDADDGPPDRIPQPAGGCNDVDPMWLGERLYFLSDRAGEFNLFSYEDGQGITQWTHHTDFPVLNASAGDGKIIYEQAGILHVFDPASGQAAPLPIHISTELPATRQYYASAYGYAQDATLSPTAGSAAFEIRGEIVTVDTETAAARNLTNTPDVAERTPAWSPDGQWLAFFSDASGEYELEVVNADGTGEVRQFALGGAGFYSGLAWAPEGERVAFVDNAATLYWLDVTDGTVHKVATDANAAMRQSSFTWAPDGNWIAYTLYRTNGMQAVHLYSLAQDRSYQVGGDLVDASSPAFDASGAYLYYLGSMDAGPTESSLDMSSDDMERTESVYIVTLQQGVRSLLAPPLPGAAEAAEAVEEPAIAVTVTVDFEGLQDRIEVFPAPPRPRSRSRRAPRARCST